MSGLSIDLKSSLLVSLTHGYARANQDFSAPKSVDLTDLALTGIYSNKNEYSRQRSLNDTLEIFSEKALTLYEALDSFEFPSGSLPGLFRTADVSDNKKLTATAVSGATVTNYLVTIDRLATAQENRSEILVSSDNTELDEGAYEFTLTVGDNSYSLGVNVDKSGLYPDTNKSLFDKLAREIGGAEDAVVAFVTETYRKIYSTLSDNMYDKVAYLTIMANEPGDSNHFSLSDDTGTLIDTLSLNNIVQGGQKCQYRLESSLSAASTNTITADGGHLTLNFLDASPDPVIITVKRGPEPTKEKISDLISDYNEYINWLDLNKRYIKPVVKQDLIKRIDAVSKDLNSIGLRVNSNGRVEILDDFNDALQSDVGTVRESLTGDGGLFSKVGEALGDILEKGVQSYAVYQDDTYYSRKGIEEGFIMRIKNSGELDLYV